jgi:hypothetical protein
MSVIRIIKGEFRNKAVVNKTFTLVKGYQTLKKGNYVTVKNEGQFPVAIDTVKVKVDNISMIEFVSGDSVSENTTKVQPKVTETDEQAMNRIANRFCVLDKMSAATINGDIRAMIVTGPPGVGKSHGIMQQLERATLLSGSRRMVSRLVMRLSKVLSRVSVCSLNSTSFRILRTFWCSMTVMFGKIRTP